MIDNTTNKWIDDAWMKQGLGTHTGVAVPPDALADLVAERDAYRAALEWYAEFNLWKHDGNVLLAKRGSDNVLGEPEAPYEPIHKRADTVLARFEKEKS